MRVVLGSIVRSKLCQLPMNFNYSEKPPVICLRFALRHSRVRGFLQRIILLPR